ncbi:MAG: cupin domain-containing protein [Chitinophagaceae bacterium]
MPFIETNALPSKEIIAGYTARTIHTGTMSFVYWTVLAGASIPIHEHEHEQVAHVLEGKFELTVDGETKVLEPGMVAVIPSYIRHGGKALT